MNERMPPDDDPIIRGLRDAGIRPLPPRDDISRQLHMRRRRRIAIALITLFALMLFVPAVAARLSDWLWYDEIGFERVFFTKIVAQWALGFPAGIIAFAFLYLNTRAALAGTAHGEIVLRFDDMYRRAGLTDAARAATDRVLRFMALAGTAIVSLVFALVVAAQWRTILQFVYRTPFGAVDPVFGRDVGYYVFILPVLELATGAVLWLLVLTLIAVLPFHLARVETGRARWQAVVQRRGQAQIAMLAALLLLVAAVRIQFVQIPGLLFGEHLPLTGARYVDLRVRIPALHVLSIATVAGALLIIWAAARGRLVAMAGRIVVTYAVIVVLAAVVPALVQRLAVQPNELA